MEESILTCPKCGHKQKEQIPTTACVPFYKCDGCDELISPHGDDCCVFCSYGDKACPVGPKKEKKTSCEC
jgi:hypothetical protein